MRTAGFMCIELLGVTGPASAPSLPREGAAPAAAAGCAAFGANELGLDCENLAKSWIGTSFLDLDTSTRAQGTDARTVFATIGAAPVTADDLARVPEPASLWLLAFGCSAMALRRARMHLPLQDPA